MKILLSIKPVYADKILSGEKRFEFRKASFSVENLESVVIYATKPVGKIVGEFEVAAVHRDRPARMWEKTKRFAGVDKVFFDDYYQGRDLAVAIEVGEVHRYSKPRELTSLGDNITPPQSFRYLQGTSQLSKQEVLELV
ncbi:MULTISPECIES: ASCH domain-containing protein [unclassified Cupriavidus]|uniref:ASCH domain-containing protein n=1 Tax=unclassified Cupriavidus TaxID=2640874 RepID=UPI00313AB2FD